MSEEITVNGIRYIREAVFEARLKQQGLPITQPTPIVPPPKPVRRRRQPKDPIIGVGITTHNRPEVFKQTYKQIKKLLPKNALLVVVDDASKTPVDEAVYRFENQAGIAKGKNKCLELLYEAGCEHYFLFDDDTYPITENWWEPYVASPEPHLMYIFPYHGGPPILSNDGIHTVWAHPCGCMLYLNKKVLETVGGMDLAYGIWGHEHVDLSNRIHNAGLTTWRFSDVSNSGELIYCGDQKGMPRTVPKATRDQHLKRNLSYYESQINSKEYKEFRQQENYVLASWLHGPDRQRNQQVSPVSSFDATKALRQSITGAELVVFSDDGTGNENPPRSPELDVYKARWVNAYNWLIQHPEARWVFLVDANDVVMQHEPWDELEEGILYSGYEALVLENEWMVKNHPSTRLQEFFKEYHQHTLLNCGVVGGSRNVMLEYLNLWVRLIEDNAHDQWKGLEKYGIGADMGPHNYIAYKYFPDRIFTGPGVTTLFKKNEVNNFSWWRHK